MLEALKKVCYKPNCYYAPVKWWAVRREPEVYGCCNVHNVPPFVVTLRLEDAEVWEVMES